MIKKNKVSITNTENQVFNNHKSKVATLIDKRAANMFKDKTFGNEYKGVFLTTESIKLVCSILSAITVFVATNWALSPLIGFAAPIVALLICGLLEVLKTSIWSKLAKIRLKYKESALLLGMAAVSLNILSGGGSVFGAIQLPNMVNSIELKAPALIDIDSIRNSYDDNFKMLDASISKMQNEVQATTSNSTKRAMSKNIAATANEKKSLFAAMELQLSSATEKNVLSLENFDIKHEKSLSTHNAKIKRQQHNCIAFAVMFELLLILCSMFGAYYLYRCEIDRTGGIQETLDQEGQTQNVLNPSLQPIKQATQNVLHTKVLPNPVPQTAEIRPQIGFKTQNSLSSTEVKDLDLQRYENPLIQPSAEPMNQTDYDKEKRVGVCVFVGCKKPFHYANDSKQYCSPKCRGRAFRLRKKEEKL